MALQDMLKRERTTTKNNTTLVPVGETLNKKFKKIYDFFNFKLYKSILIIKENIIYLFFKLKLQFSL